MWATPIYSTKNLVNRTEAVLLGKSSSEWVDPFARTIFPAFGTEAHLLDKISSEWNRGPFTRQNG